jgi:hypothetical protein
MQQAAINSAKLFSPSFVTLFSFASIFFITSPVHLLLPSTLIASCVFFLRISTFFY